MQKLLKVKITPTVYIFVRACFSKMGQAYYPEPNNMKSRQQHIGQSCGILIITARNITLLLSDPNPPMAHPSVGTMAWMGSQTLISHFVLLGLFTHTPLYHFLFSVIMVMFLVALSGNGLMTLLINVDSRLHNPMYFFLGWLSLMDVMLISTIVPWMAADFLLGQGSSSFTGCGLQILFFLTLLGDECFLLVFMAYDHYVAISNPLRYSVVMSSGSWWEGPGSLA